MLTPLRWPGSEDALSGITGLLLISDPEFALQGLRLLSRNELTTPQHREVKEGGEHCPVLLWGL